MGIKSLPTEHSNLTISDPFGFVPSVSSSQVKCLGEEMLEMNLLYKKGMLRYIS